MSKLKTVFAAILTGSLIACGGGGGGSDSGETESESSNIESGSSSSSGTNTDATNQPSGEVKPVEAVSPGGLYVGYYKEDASTNPEDPTLGSLYLNLPTADSNFAGSMSFTYVGCQSFNVGTISGNKSGLDLVGSWTGTVDGRPQKGQYTGQYNTQLASYQGTYTNAGGKQFVRIPDCIEYYVGPNGTWELFAIGQTVSSAPTATGVMIQGNQINWYPPANNGGSILSITDQSIAASGGANAIVWQNLYNAGVISATLPSSVALAKGKQYILSATTVNTDGERNYFSSKAFTAP